MANILYIELIFTDNVYFGPSFYSNLISFKIIDILPSNGLKTILLDTNVHIWAYQYAHYSSIFGPTPVNQITFHF